MSITNVCWFCLCVWPLVWTQCVLQCYSSLSCYISLTHTQQPQRSPLTSAAFPSDGESVTSQTSEDKSRWAVWSSLQNEQSLSQPAVETIVVHRRTPAVLASQSECSWIFWRLEVVPMALSSFQTEITALSDITWRIKICGFNIWLKKQDVLAMKKIWAD